MAVYGSGTNGVDGTDGCGKLTELASAGSLKTVNSLVSDGSNSSGVVLN